MISEIPDQRDFESWQSLWDWPQYRNSRTFRQLQQASDKGRGDDGDKNARYTLVALQQEDNHQRSASNRKCGPIDPTRENPLAYGEQIASRSAPVSIENPSSLGV